MAVESTGFRFYTRTRSEDYRVFADEGRELRNKNDFLRLRDAIAGCSNEDDEGAAVFEDRGMIHLVAFGFMRGDLDRGNRTKRFSFCRVYPKSQAGAALNALARIAEDWDGTAEFADSLIEEIPVMRKTDFEDFKGREKRSEDVRFDCNRFFKWLDTPAGSPVTPANVSAFKAGEMLRYYAGEIFPASAGTEIEDDDEMPGLRSLPLQEKNKPGKLPVILAVMLAVLCAVLGVWGWKQFQESSKLSQKLQELSQKLRTEQQTVSELRSELASRDNEISDLKKIRADQEKEIKSKDEEIKRLKQELTQERNRKNRPSTNGKGNAKSAEKKTTPQDETVKPAESVNRGCSSGIVSAGVLPFVYLASPNKGQTESPDTTSKKNEEAINVEITGNIIDNMCVHDNHDNHDNIVNTYNTMGSNIMGSSIRFNHAGSSGVAYSLVCVQGNRRAEVSKKSSQSEKA